MYARKLDPTDGVGVPFPQPRLREQRRRAEGTMTMYPARGDVFITLSAWAGGEERLRHLSDGEIIVKDELNPLLFRPSFRISIIVGITKVGPI